MTVAVPIGIGGVGGGGNDRWRSEAVAVGGGRLRSVAVGGGGWCGEAVERRGNIFREGQQILDAIYCFKFAKSHIA